MECRFRYAPFHLCTPACFITKAGGPRDWILRISCITFQSVSDNVHKARGLLAPCYKHAVSSAEYSTRCDVCAKCIAISWRHAYHVARFGRASAGRRQQTAMEPRRCNNDAANAETAEMMTHRYGRSLGDSGIHMDGSNRANDTTRFLLLVTVLDRALQVMSFGRLRRHSLYTCCLV